MPGRGPRRSGRVKFWKSRGLDRACERVGGLDRNGRVTWSVRFDSDRAQSDIKNVSFSASCASCQGPRRAQIWRSRTCRTRCCYRRRRRRRIDDRVDRAPRVVRRDVRWLQGSRSSYSAGQRGFGRRGLGDEACCAKSTALEQGPHLSGAIEVLYRLLGEYPPLARRSAAPGSVQKPPREHERSRLRPEELPGLERTGSPPSPRLHLRDFTQRHLRISRKTNEGLTRFRHKVVGFRAPGNQATPPFFDREIPEG